LFGRILGGLSTAILFSCFESWLISSAQSPPSGPPVSQGELSAIFGRASMINGFVAAAMGVFSNHLAEFTSTFTSPFIASAIFLVVAYLLIASLWVENYGAGGSDSNTGVVDILQLSRLKQGWRIIREDPALLTLGLTQTCFEGSMYLFVFLWVPSMQAASAPGVALPLGYIFSAFMFSMMIGSLLYTSVVQHSLPHPQSSGSDPSLVLHAKLSSLVCLTAGLALAGSVSAQRPETRFWAFCVFEGCVGMYYPVQGMLRGSMISNDHRATLSSLFRMPLNIFVIFALLSGVSSARQIVFAGCTLSLVLASVMTAVVVVRKATLESSPRAFS